MGNCFYCYILFIYFTVLTYNKRTCRETEEHITRKNMKLKCKRTNKKIKISKCKKITSN